MPLFTSILRKVAGRLLTGACIALPALTVHAQNGSTPLIWEARSPSNTVSVRHRPRRRAQTVSPQSRGRAGLLGNARARVEASPTDQSAMLAATTGLAAGQSHASHLAGITGSWEGTTRRRASVDTPVMRRVTSDDAGMMGSAARERPQSRLDIHQRAARSGTESASLSSSRSRDSSRSRFLARLQRGCARRWTVSQRQLERGHSRPVLSAGAGDEKRLWELVNKEVDVASGASAGIAQRQPRRAKPRNDGEDRRDARRRRAHAGAGGRAAPAWSQLYR